MKVISYNFYFFLYYCIILLRKCCVVMKLLDKIQNPSDINKLNINELEQLAIEIRKFLIENISKTGGHLASNLGIVELTISLLYNFDFTKDKVIFDVGHQSYVYKILTNRKDKFNSLRQERTIPLDLSNPKTYEKI